MIHPDTFVSPTSKGMGLFANRNFQRGEILWIIDDNDIKISLADYLAFDEIQRQKLNIYSYIDFYHRVIIPWDEGKYINHGCEPNLTGVIQYDNISVALKDIKKGEEIVEDYSYYFGHFETFECLCGSYQCRKIISSEQGYRADLRLDLKEAASLINSLEQPLLKIKTKENGKFLEILENYGLN
jgi:hypothetical protein